MRTLIRPWSTPVILAGLLLLSSIAFAQETVYQDQNQYFVIVPPQDWVREDFPEESIRSKVAYYKYSGSALRISLLSAPDQEPGISFDEWYSQREQRVSILRERYPGSRTTMQKSRLGNHKTIEMTLSVPGAVEQKLILLKVGSLQYTLTYSASNPSEFNQHQDVFKRFVNGFVPLQADHTFSEQEITEARLAFKKALAMNAELTGDRQIALMFVHEGLVIDPDNRELKEMKQRLMR